MGVSLAHLTAVVVPIIGAALWQRLGYQFPFLFGTLFIFFSLWLTQKIDVAKQRVPGAPPLSTDSEMAQEEMTADGALLPGQSDGQIIEPESVAALELADEERNERAADLSRKATR
jgi:hypothetical protein